MGTEITLNIPQEIYDHAERLARLTNRPIGELLAHSIVLPSIQEELYPGVSEQEAQQMAREEEAWHRLHPELLNSHAGQHVAVYAAQVVDHDSDFEALIRRVGLHYPNQFVWIDKVFPEPEPVLYFRSPRLIR